MEKRIKTLESALIITVGFLVLSFWIKKPWPVSVALVVGALGAFSPWAAEKIHQGWMLLAKGLGWVNSRILLSLVFFLFLTPIAWLARKSGAAGLQLRRKKGDGSYYAERNHTYAPKDMENTW